MLNEDDTGKRAARHRALPLRDEDVGRRAPSPSSYAYAAARSCVLRSTVYMSLPDALAPARTGGEVQDGSRALSNAGAGAFMPLESGASSGAEFPGVLRVRYAGSSTASSAGEPSGPDADTASGCSLICSRI